MSWVAIAVGVVGTGVSIYTGARQRSKAKKELNKLNAEKPVETIPEEVIRNQELAKLRASTGLPSEQYSLSQKNIQRQQMRSLRGASDRRMGLGLIGSLNDNANLAQGRLDSENAQARQQNEKVYMDTNNQVANWKKGIFDRNVRQVWDRNFDYNMGLMGAGNQNIANGINSGINLAGSALMSSGLGNGGGTNSGWSTGLFAGGRARRFGRRAEQDSFSGYNTGNTPHTWN